jgi:hypothetical protein
MATANNPKGEGIFENLSNRLIDFCYEFFTEARLALFIPQSRFHHIRLCLRTDVEPVTHLA